MSPPLDAVAAIARRWQQECPQLDVSPLLVVGRMQRLTQLFEPHLRPPFAEAGLANGDFDVLAALRRAGDPFTLTPGTLSASLLVTTGAITKRVDRLERAGLVRRETSAADGRGRLISLEPEGVRLAERLMERHLANEAELLSGLSEGERSELAALLSKLSLTLDTDRASRESGSPRGAADLVVSLADDVSDRQPVSRY